MIFTNSIKALPYQYKTKKLQFLVTKVKLKLLKFKLKYMQLQSMKNSYKLN